MSKKGFISSSRYTVVLDANVLMGIPGDYLMELARRDLFRAKFSRGILTEFREMLIKRKQNADPQLLDELVEMVEKGLPAAMVYGHEKLVPCMNLPDENDNHVLAAAIRCDADCIVSNNLSDFPDDALVDYDVHIESMDEFMASTIDLDNDLALIALDQVADNNSLELREVIDIFNKTKQLQESTEILRQLIDDNSDFE